MARRLTTPLMSERKLCINCNIYLNIPASQSGFLVLEQNTRVISLISNWISPLIITEEDYICEACFGLAVQAVNAELHADTQHDRCAGPSLRGHQKVCLICGRSVVKIQSHQIFQMTSPYHTEIIQIVKNSITPREIQTSDRICHACYVRMERSVARNQTLDDRIMLQNIPGSEEALATEDEHTESLEIAQNQEQHSDTVPAADSDESENESESTQSEHRETPEHQHEQPSLPDTILTNYRRAPNTASHCIFYGCDNISGLHSVSESLRKTLLINHKYYVPKLCKICSEHLSRSMWHHLYDAENSMSTFNVEHIEHMLSYIALEKPFMDFSSITSVEEIDDHLFGYWMGMTKNNFLTLLTETPRILEAHRGILGLACILIKMRTGDSDDRISTLLKVPRQTIERKMAIVRDILLQDFVPRNLGINHKTRAETLHHNLLIPNGLFNEDNNQCVVICDGTYIFLNKSGNYMFQKDTYSLHKYRNLVKPFMLVLCNGYILDCFGPFKATTSDADIIKYLFQDEDSPLRQYFCENDVFILDRGFRDCINLLQSCNYQVYVPETLLEGEHQLTTTQANRSRCVTICRWVVEVVNGYFKRDYRLLRFEHFNKTVPNMMTYFQIAAALINKFGVRIQDRVDAAQILSIIRERMPLQNNLAMAVNSLHMNRRASSFQNITVGERGDILFPRLQYEELILFALGTYQIKQARSYGEHIRFHGQFRIEVCREMLNIEEFGLRGSGDNSLIRGKIKSRHVGRRQYYIYILIENNMNGREAIQEYCCSCIVGRRTVGCCAHVMTIVLYLGWARFQENINAPAAILDDVVVREDIY